MELVSRVDWGARAPRYINTRPPSSVDSWAQHYSAASPSQTVRAIQDYHMDVKGWSDIGYNFLVDIQGRCYVGRGWDVVGAHVEGHNTHTLGVCFIGRDSDVTDPALRTLRELYDIACAHFGQTLFKRWHSCWANSPATGDNVTSCPGVRLRAWVQTGMPLPGTAPAPAPFQEGTMLFAKLSTSNTTYVCEGHEYRPMDSKDGPAALEAGRRAGIPLVTVNTVEELAQLAGLPYITREAALNAMRADILAALSTLDMDPTVLGQTLAESPEFINAVAEAVRAQVGMIPTAREIAGGAIDEYVRRISG